jgi:hypothetical protein
MGLSLMWSAHSGEFTSFVRRPSRWKSFGDHAPILPFRPLGASERFFRETLAVGYIDQATGAPILSEDEFLAQTGRLLS